MASPTLVLAAVPGDIDGDGCVDLMDFAALQTEFTGPACLPPEFTDMVFTQETISVATADIVDATIDGTLLVSSNGVVNGTVTVTFADNSSAVIVVNNDDITASTTGSDLNLLVGNPNINIVDIDGLEVLVTEVIDDFVSDGSAGISPAAFSPSSRNMLALLALQSTVVWRSNVEAARGTQLPAARGGEPGFWCRVDAAVGAGAMLFVTALGCGALLAGCAAGGTITFGGILFLCGPLVTACNAGALGTSADVYAYIISVWQV